MLSRKDIVFVCRRLGKYTVGHELFEEASEEYARIADPKTNERDFVFGYAANAIKHIKPNSITAEQALYMGLIDGP